MATQVQRRRGTTAQFFQGTGFKGAEGEFTYDTTLKTLRVHDGVTTGGFPLVRQNNPITASTKCKITFDAQGLVTGGADLTLSDITDIADLGNTYLAKNAAITAGTYCKITFDSKGLVTGGSSLSTTDIPALPISKVTNLQTTLDSKMEKIPVVTPSATLGTINLTDNAVNKITLTGSALLQTPSVSDNTIYHQILVQVYKSNSNYAITFSATKYFGTTTAPDTSAAGYYNIYFEYDAVRNIWYVGAIKKST